MDQSGSGTLDIYLRFPVPEYYYEDMIWVWWDMVSCPWPKENELNSIRHNIVSALKTMNYHGPAKIIAYSNANTIPSHVRAALVDQEIEVCDVEEGEEVRRMMAVDILLRAHGDRKHANHLVITNEVFLAHRRVSYCNLLLAANGPRISGLCFNRAQIVWEWSSLAAGGCPLMVRQIQKDLRLLKALEGEGEECYEGRRD